MMMRAVNMQTSSTYEKAGVEEEARSPPAVTRAATVLLCCRTLEDPAFSVPQEEEKEARSPHSASWIATGISLSQHPMQVRQLI